VNTTDFYDTEPDRPDWEAVEADGEFVREQWDDARRDDAAADLPLLTPQGAPVGPPSTLARPAVPDPVGGACPDLAGEPVDAQASPPSVSAPPTAAPDVLTATAAGQAAHALHLPVRFQDDTPIFLAALGRQGRRS
jgi:hypothetical protein